MVSSMCDTGVDAHSKTEDHLKPQYHKNLKDPMTIYARHAMKRQTEDKDEVKVHLDEMQPPPPQCQQAQEAQPAVTERNSENDQEDVNRRTFQTANETSPQATLQATSRKLSGHQSNTRPAAVAANTAQATSPLDASLAPAQPPMMTAAEVRIEEKTRKAKQHSGGLKIFSGNGNMSLALEIAKNLGINLGKATVGRFADGEVNVVIHENVRGKDVYVIQPTCMPVNDNLMELLLMVSTLRRASARRITVVIPYYGYARQDRKMQVSRPIENQANTSSLHDGNCCRKDCLLGSLFLFPPFRPLN